MKKVTNFVLVAIGLVGTYLVSEGIITGEELTAMQSIVGMALGGGALTIGLVISILTALPKSLTNAGYDKLVATYGKDKVDGFINELSTIQNTQEELKQLTSEVKDLLIEAKESREALLNE